MRRQSYLFVMAERRVTLIHDFSLVSLVASQHALAYCQIASIPTRAPLLAARGYASEQIVHSGLQEKTTGTVANHC